MLAGTDIYWEMSIAGLVKTWDCSYFSGPAKIHNVNEWQNKNKLDFCACDFILLVNGLNFGPGSDICFFTFSIFKMSLLQKAWKPLFGWCSAEYRIVFHYAI